MRRFPSPRTRQSGFSLLEVLISILVLSFGILGAVGLQAASLQVTREARWQASAVRLAEEIGELMRSNKAAAVGAGNAYAVALKSGDTVPNPSCGYATSGAGCTSSADVAKRDLYDWWARVQAELPGARVAICEDGVLYDGSGLPQWTCSNSGGTWVVKLGWTRGNTLRGATGSDATTTAGPNTGAFDKALRPAVIFTVIPGSTT